MTTSIASRFCRKLVMLFRRASAPTSPKPWFLKTRRRSSLACHFPLLGKPRETHLRNSSARLVDFAWPNGNHMLRQSPLCRRECATGKGPDSGNQALASTEDLLSTSGWRELLADFTTGPQTRLIAIKVMRLP